MRRRCFGDRGGECSEAKVRVVGSMSFGQRLLADSQILGRVIQQRKLVAVTRLKSTLEHIYGPLAIMVGSHQQGEGAVGYLAWYRKANRFRKGPDDAVVESPR